MGSLCCHGASWNLRDDARDAAEELGCPVIVKAQVHAGGRGKAGGVKFAASADDAVDAASAMLGTRMVTHQTGPSGVPVEQGDDHTRRRISRTNITCR